MYYVRPIFDVDYYTEEDRRANVLFLVRYPTSTIAQEKIVEPMYYVRRIFDVDYHTTANHRPNVYCSSNIRCRLLH